MIRKSFYGRVYLTFFVLSLVLIIIVLSIFCSIFYQTYNSQLHEQIKANVLNVSAEIESMVHDCKQAINALSIDNDINAFFEKNANEETYNDIVKKLYYQKNRYVNKVELSVIDFRTNEWLSTDPENTEKDLTTTQNWGVFRKANISNEFGIYSAAKDVFLNENNRIFMAKAHRDNTNAILGYIIAEIPRTTIFNIISSYSSIYNTNLIIVNSNNAIIFHSRGTANEGLDKIKYYGNSKWRETKDTDQFIWEHFICQYSSISNLYVLHEIPANASQMIRDTISETMLPSLIGIIILGVIFSFVVARIIAQPITDLQDAISKVKEEILPESVDAIREDELGELGVTFYSMTDKIKELNKEINDKKRSLWLAETRSLNLQMNSHFLYNTLDLIKWNAKLERLEEISDIVVHLGRLLRRVMNNKNDVVPLSYELEIVTSFIKIQKKRYGNELNLKINISDELLSYLIPKLILQPIVENSIVHGFRDRSQNCTISIDSYEKEGFMYFIVEDNGVGIKKENLKDILEVKQGNTHHIGLNNVDRRIKLHGNKDCSIKVESIYGKGTKVTLSLCKIKGNAQNM